MKLYTLSNENQNLVLKNGLPLYVKDNFMCATFPIEGRIRNNRCYLSKSVIERYFPPKENGSCDGKGKFLPEWQRLDDVDFIPHPSKPYLGYLAIESSGMSDGFACIFIENHKYGFEKNFLVSSEYEENIPCQENNKYVTYFDYDKNDRAVCSYCGQYLASTWTDVWPRVRAKLGYDVDEAHYFHLKKGFCDRVIGSNKPIVSYSDTIDGLAHFVIKKGLNRQYHLAKKLDSGKGYKIYTLSFPIDSDEVVLAETHHRNNGLYIQRESWVIPTLREDLFCPQNLLRLDAYCANIWGGKNG